jgi:hypothetical protein
MSSDITIHLPQPFEFDIPAGHDVSLAGSVGVTGLPDHYTISIDRLPDIHLRVDQLPHIQLGIDPLEVKPLDLSLRIKEFPSIRVHLPADFKVGVGVLGLELLTVRLCGLAMAITEPFQPNPCEVCDERMPHLQLESR